MTNRSIHKLIDRPTDKVAYTIQRQAKTNGKGQMERETDRDGKTEAQTGKYRRKDEDNRTDCPTDKNACIIQRQTKRQSNGKMDKDRQREMER